MTLANPRELEFERAVREVVDAAIAPMRAEIAELCAAVEDLETFIADPFAATCEKIRRTAEHLTLDYWEPYHGHPSEEWRGLDVHPASTFRRWRRDRRIVILALDKTGVLSIYLITLGGAESKCAARIAPLDETWRWITTGGPMPGEVPAPDAPTTPEGAGEPT